MRIFLVLSLAVGLVSCASKEEAEVSVSHDSAAVSQQVPPERIQVRPVREGDNVGFNYSYTDKSIDSIFRLPLAQRPGTLDEATTYYLSLPPKVNLPPHLLPPMELARVAMSDSTAIYTFKPQRGAETAQIEFLKIRKGSDSAWIVKKLTHGLDPRQR